MSDRGYVIERLKPPVGDADVGALAALLVDAVDSGAAVSFLAPLSAEQAERWWRQTVASCERGSIILVARDGGGGIVGSVQLHPAWAPNQPHRADVAKLLVHRSCRGVGLGARLMKSVEEAAREANLTLLTLDTRRGSAAERLYRRLEWSCGGTIPRFALDPDGTAMHDTVIFYKELKGAGVGRRL